MTNHSKPKWRSDIIVSVCAMLISMATFGIYLYQTKIIQEQARASMYPHLAVTRSYSTGKNAYFKFTVRNVGIGPAFLKTMEFKYKGKIYQSKTQSGMCPSMYFLTSIYPKNLKFPYIGNGSTLPMVIPAGEEENFLIAQDPQKDALFLAEVFDEAEIRVCYSSVYKEYWTASKWQQPIECKNCENEDLFKPTKK